jgi:integrase
MSSRRPQGEGSVYRLPDGRRRGVVDLGWHGGKRRRKYITRGTQAEVVRELRRLTAAAEAGRLPIERAPTLGQWLERYLDEVAAPSVRPSSLRRCRQELRLYIAPALGKVPLDKLKPSQVSDFYRSQLLHLSPGSVRRLHALSADRWVSQCVAADSVEPGNRRRPTVADVRRGSPVRRQGGATISGCGVG